MTCKPCQTSVHLSEFAQIYEHVDVSNNDQRSRWQDIVTREYDTIIHEQRVKIDINGRTWANFSSERIVNAWTFLPDTVDFSSISGFKRSIHKVDFSRLSLLSCFYDIYLMFGTFAIFCVFMYYRIVFQSPP